MKQEHPRGRERETAKCEREKLELQIEIAEYFSVRTTYLRCVLTA